MEKAKEKWAGTDSIVINISNLFPPVSCSILIFEKLSISCILYMLLLFLIFVIINFSMIFGKSSFNLFGLIFNEN